MAAAALLLLLLLYIIQESGWQQPQIERQQIRPLAAAAWVANICLDACLWLIIESGH
jgi:hypothetical protein